MLCNKITLYSYILSLYIMQQDNIYGIKEKKNYNNLKTFSNNTKTYQLKVEMQEKLNKKKSTQKILKKN